MFRVGLAIFAGIWIVQVVLCSLMIDRFLRRHYPRLAGPVAIANALLLYWMGTRLAGWMLRL